MITTLHAGSGLSPYQAMIEKLEIEKAENTRLKADNDRLHKIVNTDELTKLYNRRAFFEKLKKFIEISHNENTPLAVVFCDIDKFKSFNDTEGHPGGDLGLIQFSKSLIAYEDEGAIAFRLGGEEFAILLIGYTPEQAEKFANKTRALVANSPVDLSALREGEPRRITASFGVANYDLQGSETVDQFLKRVDDALYVAKNEGRNTVVSVVKNDFIGGSAFYQIDHAGLERRVVQIETSKLGIGHPTRIRQSDRPPTP